MKLVPLKRKSSKMTISDINKSKKRDFFLSVKKDVNCDVMHSIL